MSNASCIAYECGQTRTSSASRTASATAVALTAARSKVRAALDTATLVAAPLRHPWQSGGKWATPPPSDTEWQQGEGQPYASVGEPVPQLRSPEPPGRKVLLRVRGRGNPRPGPVASGAQGRDRPFRRSGRLYVAGRAT